MTKTSKTPDALAFLANARHARALLLRLTRNHEWVKRGSAVMVQLEHFGLATHAAGKATITTAGREAARSLAA